MYDMGKPLRITAKTVGGASGTAGKTFSNVIGRKRRWRFETRIFVLTCLSLCNTQTRAVNLIHAVLCDDEGVTQARGC